MSKQLSCKINSSSFFSGSMPIASHFVSTTTNWENIFVFFLVLFEVQKPFVSSFDFISAASFCQFGVYQPMRDCVTFQFRFYCRAAAHFVLIVKRFRGNHTKNFLLSFPTRWDQRNARFTARENIFYFRWGE